MKANQWTALVIYGIAICVIVAVQSFTINELVKRGEWMREIDAVREQRGEWIKAVELRLEKLETK